MAAVKKWRFIIGVLLFVVLICALLYLRPIPKTQGQPTTASPPLLQSVNLPWPASGQAAVGAVGYGLLASSATQAPVPMASIAKIMAALAVLEKKPLAVSGQGPIITISSDDAATYQSFYSQGQSVVPVSTGEQISEYKALQAMLIPSANNMAYTLAAWAFGSVDNYLVYANQQARVMGLANTHLADPSGFSPQTVSTANDLITLGEAALKNPMVASIVAQNQTDFPVAGTIKNVNFLLGSYGVNGIKTGNTDQAGGCYLLSAKRTIQDQPVTTLVAVLGAPNLAGAITSGRDILVASDSGFANTQIASSNQSVGVYKTAWGTTANAITQSGFSALVWEGLPAKTTVSLKNLRAGAAKGALVGTVTFKNGNFSASRPIYLDQELTKPSLRWRIFH